MLDVKKIRESIENRDLDELIKSNYVNSKDIAMELLQINDAINRINNIDDDLRDELNFRLEMLHMHAITVNDAIFGGLVKQIERLKKE